MTKTEKRNSQNERVIEILFWNPSSPIKFDTAQGPYKKNCFNGF